VKPHEPERARVRHAAACAAALSSLAFPATAADVYVSQSADGSVRYSTQAIDGSYRLLLREPAELRGVSPAPLARGGKPDATSATIHALIERSARLHGVPVDLAQAVARVESNYSPAARSHAGAQGVMQLMPATAQRYGVNGADIRDPEKNIDAGVRHLRDLLALHKGNVVLALSAYNAGSGAVARHSNRIPPYRETMLYVPAVLARTHPHPTP
jgi:soluble lytic murein transglycosylase-like protein